MSQFGFSTLQVISSHTRLVATLLGSVASRFPGKISLNSGDLLWLLSIHWVPTWILRDCQVSLRWKWISHSIIKVHSQPQRSDQVPPSQCVLLGQSLWHPKASSPQISKDLLRGKLQGQLCLPRAGRGGQSVSELNTALSLGDGDCL